MAAPTRDPDRDLDLDDPSLGLDDDADDRPLSRSRLRDEARAYLELAEALTKGKHRTLPDPPFDPGLRAAIVDAQRFVKNARSRQIRRVAQLLREAGPIADLRDALDGRTAEARAAQALERACEAWRARLLAEGDDALALLCADHPGADRQRLRQLARQARRSPADARSKRAATSLIREVRALLVAAGPEPGPAPAAAAEAGLAPAPEPGLASAPAAEAGPAGGPAASLAAGPEPGLAPAPAAEAGPEPSPDPGPGAPPPAPAGARAPDGG